MSTNLRFAHLHAGEGRLQFHNTVVELAEDQQKRYPVRVSVAIDKDNKDFRYTVKSHRDQFSRKRAATILTGRFTTTRKGRRGPAEHLPPHLLEATGFESDEALEQAIAELVSKEE